MSKPNLVHILYARTCATLGSESEFYFSLRIDFGLVSDLEFVSDLDHTG